MESFFEDQLTSFLALYYCPDDKDPIVVKLYLQEFIHDLCENGLEEKLMEIYGDDMEFCDRSREIMYKRKRKWMR